MKVVYFKINYKIIQTFFLGSPDSEHLFSRSSKQLTGEFTKRLGKSTILKNLNEK